jgi:hypothetical protein
VHGQENLMFCVHGCMAAAERADRTIDSVLGSAWRIGHLSGRTTKEVGGDEPGNRAILDGGRLWTDDQTGWSLRGCQHRVRKVPGQMMPGRRGRGRGLASL